jgi:hypothetical protein
MYQITRRLRIQNYILLPPSNDTMQQLQDRIPKPSSFCFFYSFYLFLFIIILDEIAIIVTVTDSFKDLCEAMMMIILRWHAAKSH